MRFSWNSPDGVIRVRHALGADAPAIEALYGELMPHNPGICVLPERLEQIAEDANSLLLVAATAGAVGGSVCVSFCLDAMFRHQPFGLVENIIVGAKARTTGLGRALMAAVDAAALDRDCSKLMLLSAADRRDAHRFFERCGYDGTAKQGFVRYRRSFDTEIIPARSANSE